MERKWNLVIGGIKGTLNETPHVTDKKVRAFFETSLNIPKEKANYILFQTFLSLLDGAEEYKRRIIVCNLQARHNILAVAMSLKNGTG